MNRTQIYLQKTQLNELRKIAGNRSATVSEVVRGFIDEKIKEVQPSQLQNRGESLYESAKRISKMGTKGPKDLAKNLDKYLYGKDFR